MDKKQVILILLYLLSLGLTGFSFLLIISTQPPMIITPSLFKDASATLLILIYVFISSLNVYSIIRRYPISSVLSSLLVFVSIVTFFLYFYFSVKLEFKQDENMWAAGVILAFLIQIIVVVLNLIASVQIHSYFKVSGLASVFRTSLVTIVVSLFFVGIFIILLPILFPVIIALLESVFSS